MTHDLDGYLIAQTADAMLFSPNEIEANGVWIPNSQITGYVQHNDARHPHVTLAVTEWFATKRGLV